MDTCAEQSASTDTLGRRTGPRRPHTIEEKRRIVEETHVKGASVATVARRHDLNANQVFAWRQRYRQGLLDPNEARSGTALLPVRVGTPTVMPTERALVQVPSSTGRCKRACEVIKIELANGHSILLQGRFDTKALARVLDLLVRR